MSKQDTSKPLQDYILYSKFARVKNNKKETWEQGVDRVMQMHQDFILQDPAVDITKFAPLWLEARQAYLEQEANGAQRALQWGGEQLIKHNFRLYNCSSSYANRIEFFHELFYILLCGAGAGYSVQKIHTDMLPVLTGIAPGQYPYTIPDSIEGWAESTGILIKAYFDGHQKPVFDYSAIRKEGSIISGGFKAPGPKPLIKAHQRIELILKEATGRKLRPFEVHRISCIIADAVVSGGVRRSALLCLFDAFDEEMMTCKTGNWFNQYPELKRSNNSAVILPNTPKEFYERAFVSVKEFGEPGFAFLKSPWHCFNPCFEIGMLPMLFTNPEWTLKDFEKYFETWIVKSPELMSDDVQFGWSTCNLSQGNGKKIKTKEDLIRAIRAATILGTFQAKYTNFAYIGKVTEQIVQRDALIGVSIAGMAENPNLLFDPEIQKEMAELVKVVNEEVASVININTAARTTCIKPDGNSSSLLGTLPGIHPGHSRKYIRNVQVNHNEKAGQVFKEINPDAVEPSVWGSTDNVISFPITLHKNALLKEDISAIDFLELVKTTQNNWIKYGTNKYHPSYKIDPTLTHNVSNTCSIMSSEWDRVKEYLWDNRNDFCGVSVISSSGDLDYQQAPYQEVLDPIELAEEFGPAAILAGGLVVDGLHAFGNLWTATDAALGRGSNIEVTPEVIATFIQKHLIPNGDNKFKFMLDVDGVIITDTNAVISHLYDRMELKKDWIRRFKKFAKNYLNGNQERCAYALKRVSIFHKWQHLLKSKQIDWENVEWEEEFKDAGEDTAQNCAGGACLI